MNRGTRQAEGAAAPSIECVGATRGGATRRRVAGHEQQRRQRVAQAEERWRAGGLWEDLDLVFSNELGRPIEAGNLLRRSFHPLLTRAGVPVMRFHDLRHTCVTLMIERGVDFLTIARVVGHRDCKGLLPRRKRPIAVCLNLPEARPRWKRNHAAGVHRADFVLDEPPSRGAPTV